MAVNATEVAGIVGVEAHGAIPLGASRAKGLKRVDVDLTVWKRFFPANCFGAKGNLLIPLLDNNPD
jgi:hypothetical protein